MLVTPPGSHICSIPIGNASKSLCDVSHKKNVSVFRFAAFTCFGLLFFFFFCFFFLFCFFVLLFFCEIYITLFTVNTAVV